MLPFWEDKCWGRVMHCFISPHASVSYLQVEQGWRCSRHYHERRANHFVVISGIIEIDQWSRKVESPLEGNILQTTCLIPGGSLVIGAGLYHRFRVLESGSMIEVYSPDGGEVELDDIVRFDVGGRV